MTSPQLIADEVTFDTLLLRAWYLQQSKRLRRGFLIGLVYSLAIMAATAGLIEIYFRVAR